MARLQIGSNGHAVLVAHRTDALLGLEQDFIARLLVTSEQPLSFAVPEVLVGDRQDVVPGVWASRGVIVVVDSGGMSNGRRGTDPRPPRQVRRQPDMGLQDEDTEVLAELLVAAMSPLILATVGETS